MTLHRIFKTALDTTSDIIYFPGAAADNAAPGFFGRTDMADEDNVVVNDHQTDGVFTIFLDAREVPKYMSNLMLPVIPSALLLFA